MTSAGSSAGDGFGDGVLAGEGVGAAAVGAGAGEQVGRDDDVALRGEFVGHLLGPVAEAEDLVDHDDDGRLLADLGIDDEGLHGAVAVLEGDVLAVAWRLLERALAQSCAGERSSSEGKEWRGRGESCAAHGVSLALGSALRQGPRHDWRYLSNREPARAGWLLPSMPAGSLRLFFYPTTLEIKYCTTR